MHGSPEHVSFFQNMADCVNLKKNEKKIVAE